jgi:hypothetical protein
VTSLDLSTEAGVLRFCELRRAEMVGCFERLGRFESNKFSFCGYVFATHAVEVPADWADLDGWKTGAKLARIAAERVRLPAKLHGVVPEAQETALFAITTRRFAKLTRAIGVLLMTEMWHVPRKTRAERDSLPGRLQDYKGPDRGEALYVQVEHTATGRRVWAAEIKRLPTRLGPWVDRTPDDAEGRLVDLVEWRS